MQTNPEQWAVELFKRLEKMVFQSPAGTCLDGEAIYVIQAAFAEREARLVGALEDVINPLGYLKRHAEAKGSQLNGMAYQIANDPSFAKSIAKEALAALKDRTHG